VTGRPTRLTDEARERFLQAIRAGAVPDVAARHAGFSAATYYRYLRSTAPEHVAFREEIHAARAALEVRLSGTIVQAAMTDPKWALVWLERHSEAWRNRDRRVNVEDAESASPVDEDSTILLDAGLIDELVPKLLEAGRRARAVGPIEAPARAAPITDRDSDGVTEAVE
jgi:hypothetical protein